jgi:hypothetical protein
MAQAPLEAPSANANVPKLLAPDRSADHLDCHSELSERGTSPGLFRLGGALGKMNGANDLFIAAHAHSLGLVLAAANMCEFKRVRDLALENWITPTQSQETGAPLDHGVPRSRYLSWRDPRVRPPEHDRWLPWRVWLAAGLQ